MLWASSQVRRLYAIGVAITCRSPQKVSVFTSRRSPQKVSVFTSLSFTTEGERLHQFVVHMLWASSPVRRPHAMGVFTSSSSTCYGRRHQFVVHMLWASSPVRQHLSDARTRAVRILSTVRAHPTLRLQVRLTHQSVSSPHTTCGPSLSSIR
jgi:hypothetical protein